MIRAQESVVILYAVIGPGVFPAGTALAWWFYARRAGS
jgi:hypothetical protein